MGPPDQRRANVLARLESGAGVGDVGRTALLLFHHMDVVQADAVRWSAGPFSAELRDGYVYGRGALDMKTTGLLQALALIRLKSENVPLARDVIWLGTADEEAGSVGMRWMIENHPDLFGQVESALTEGDTIHAGGGGGEAPGAQRYWGVDVAEKVTAWLKLTARGKAGHGSVPDPPNSAVVRLVRALDRVGKHETPLVVLPAVASYYSALAERFPDLPADKLRDLATALRKDASFRASFLADPARAATVRNTIAVTVLQGGPQTNVIPSTAVAHLDCRLLPGQSPEEFLATIRRVVDDPDVLVEPLAEPEGASSSSTDTPLYRAIESAGRTYAPGVPVVPTLLTSWTESSLLRPLGIHSYGFEPYALDDRELSLSHGDDERISVENVRQGLEILYAIVREAAAAPPAGAASPRAGSDRTARPTRSVSHSP